MVPTRHSFVDHKMYACTSHRAKCTRVLLFRAMSCQSFEAIYAKLNRIMSSASILLSGLLYAHGQPGCHYCISILCTVVPDRKGRTPMNCTQEGITHSGPCLWALCSPLPCPLVVMADALVGMGGTDLFHLPFSRCIRVA